MTATGLSVPEALVVLVGPHLERWVTVSATLAELELRGSIRCLSSQRKGLKKMLKPGSFKLELLDSGSTGDEVLDATFAAVSPYAAPEREHLNVSAASAAARKLDLGRRYIDQLLATGWLGATGKRTLLRRPKLEVVNQGGLQAMKQELFAALLGGQQLPARDEALIALIAAHKGDLGSAEAVLGRLMPRVENNGRDRKELREERKKAMQRAVEALNSSPLASALYKELHARQAARNA